MSIADHRYDLIAGTAPLSVGVNGSGKSLLLLHSGAGPDSIRALGDALSARHRVMIPTMPGFDDEVRPPWVKTISDVATLYLALLERIDATDVTIIGNSVGGWIAAETALRASPRVSSIVLMDAVGLDPSPEGGDIADPLTLGPAVAAYAFHDPQRFGSPPDEATALRVRRNQQVLQSYAAEPFMNDPSLRGRLPGMPVRSLVLWGKSDRIVTPAYGRQFSDLMPSSEYVLVPQAGHFPHIEAAAAVIDEIERFL